MKNYRGFTLIELLITIVIVGILLVVGLPSMQVMMKNGQLVASTNELISAFHIARSESIKLNSRVTICESSDGASCATTGSWKEGWIVFVDADGDLAGTGAACSAPNTDCLLRVHAAINDNLLTVDGVDVVGSGGVSVTSVTFTSRGLPKADDGTSQSATFSLCSLEDSSTTLDSRAVVLGLTGRVRVSKTAVMSCP